MSSKDLKIRFESQFSRMNCQMFSWGFSSGHLAGNAMSVMLESDVQPAGEMPSGLIDEDRGVCAWRDLRGDLFGQVKVHRLGVLATRHERARRLCLPSDRSRRKCRPRRSAGRSRGAWARAALGPTAGDLVLLPDPRLVGEPEFYRAGDRRPSRARILFPGAWESFFKILDSAGGLGMMAGAGRELATNPSCAARG